MRFHSPNGPLLHDEGRWPILSEQCGGASILSVEICLASPAIMKHDGLYPVFRAIRIIGRTERTITEILNMAVEKRNYFRKIFLLASITFLFIFSGCMMMSARTGRALVNNDNRPTRIKEVNKGNVIDDLLQEMVENLNQKQLNISNVAVWQIKSKTAGIDVEMVRQKLTAKLVNQTKFIVIARERLNDLLKEHNLSLSGTIDEKSAVEIGRLISVEGFIDGYVSLNDNLLSISLRLIETKSGAIVWAKTAESLYRSR